jgi:hypothetical protein
LLRRNSSITTVDDGAGNDNNREIEAVFIIAPATEDSYITADGGNITITQYIFSIADGLGDTKHHRN